MLTANGFKQELLSNGNFRINDVARPLDEKRVEQLKLLQVKPLANRSQERTGIRAADAPAYGIDLLSPTLTIYHQPEPNIIQWALKDGRCYVYNQTTRRVLQMPEQHYDALNDAADRLDVQRLLPGHAPKEITINDTVWYEDAHGEWFVRGDINRPAASLAMRDLFAQLFRLQLNQFTGPTLTTEPTTVMRYTTEIAGAEDITIQLYRQPDGSVIVRSSFLDQPAQQLDAPVAGKRFWRLK